MSHHKIQLRLKEVSHRILTVCIIIYISTFTFQLLKDASASGETEYDKDRNIGLPPGTPVAFNVHELNVDINNGALQLVLSSGIVCRYC